MRPRWIVVVIGIPMAGVLAGCASTPPPAPVVQTEIVVPRVAPSLRRCLPEPSPPPRPAKRGQAANYMHALAAAGDDCRRKLAAVDRVLIDLERAGDGR